MSKVITLLLIGIAIYYWSHTQKLKQLAIVAAKRRCQQEGLQFLDDTVVFKKFYIKKEGQNRKRLLRQYEFEFSSTGEHRYLGQVLLHKEHLVSIDLQAYSIN